MTHIFSRGSLYQQLSIDLRQLAGLILKNYFINLLAVLPSLLATFIKNEILAALTDPLPEIRNTAGTILGKISSATAIDNWIDITATLISMLDLQMHGQPLATEGALIAITRICEDSNDKLDSAGQGLLDNIVTRLIALLACGHENANIRLYALKSMNALLFQLTTQSIGSMHLPNFLSAISKLSTDPIAAVRFGVCQALVTLGSIAPLTLHSCITSDIYIINPIQCDTGSGDYYLV
jgi:transportin-1